MGKLIHGGKVYANVVHGELQEPLKELFSFNQSQGGVWINTYVDVTDIDTVRFVFSSGTDNLLMRQLPVSDIAVYTGGADVYTTVFTSVEIGSALNVRIYNDMLFVSFNGTGASTNVVTVYELSENPVVPVGNLRFSSWDRYKQIENTAVMEITTTDNTLTSVYKGGSAIECIFTIPIDVTGIDNIEGFVDIGTGYSLSQFPFYVAICEKFPTSTSVNPSSWSPVVQDMTNVANSTYNFRLDTSNLTGGYMLVFILTGMNATVRGIQTITGG